MKPAPKNRRSPNAIHAPLTRTVSAAAPTHSAGTKRQGIRPGVSRAEQESGQGRTVDLLEWLHRKHPQTRWALMLGTDLDAEKPQWKRFERVEQLARLITVRRGGYGEGGVAIPEISSTQVRALLKSGGDASQLVPRTVLEAIRDAGTYR